MLYFAILSNILMYFIPWNIPNGNLHNPKESSISVNYDKQYRIDKESSYLISLEGYTKFGNRFFRPAFGFYMTDVGSHFVSFVLSKELMIVDKVVIYGHLGPSYSNIRGVDRKRYSGYMNFNIAIGTFYNISNNMSLGLEWRHLSNYYTSLPNGGLDTIGFKVRFKF